MNCFSEYENGIEYRYGGETVRVLPWGENSFRVLCWGGALSRTARHFRPITGGDYQLKVTFDSNPDEKIYGMGQYQQDLLDLKGCNLELDNGR